ncbi:diacylglycerol/polyprenol kinase family protein [Cyanobium sp. Morenito 9A2]|uniref:diacylglycerol/polyprenol kinase family protein n=1 Tax=Cyanobium sp. Morenito 9A2 TaxID=2823718 RepID=UPI0020CCD2E2|nr:dolichol kinase [Cyanobium sp. Morenito 9A2]MCP9848878.1 dolichol kinase [Cyanobium sp. Morenito 9A2]
MAAEVQRQLLGVAVVTLWLTLVAGGAVMLRARWPQHKEWSRKLVHIGSGAVVLLAWGFDISRPVALGAALTATVLTSLNHRFRLLGAIEDVGRRSYGTIAYGASISLLLALFWPQQPAAVAAGVLVMAVGDGLAGLVGASVPSTSWSLLGQRKSLLGTTTMAAASLAVLTGLWITSGCGAAWGSAAQPLLLITLVATLLEQVAVAGLDNFSVPVAVGLLWSQLRP